MCLIIFYVVDMGDEIDSVVVDVFQYVGQFVVLVVGIGYVVDQVEMLGFGVGKCCLVEQNNGQLVFYLSSFFNV